MNVHEGNHRITFKNSRDVVLLNSDTKRITYWKECGGGHSLFTLFQAKIYYCRIGEPLLLSATTYDNAPTPHGGIVAAIETSYHPVFAPACPELLGPVSAAGELLSPEQLAALFASIEENNCV